MEPQDGPAPAGLTRHSPVLEQFAQNVTLASCPSIYRGATLPLPGRRQRAMASAIGSPPTLIGLPARFVAVAIGVTVAGPKLAT
jgi:hypothetical protein